jgi:LPXTG-site transpeptidase (sortase) family protein
MGNLRCRRQLVLALAFALAVGLAGIVITPGRSQADSGLPNLIVRPSNLVTVPVAVRTVDPMLAVAAARPLTPPPPPNPAPPLPVPASMPNPANRVPLVALGNIEIPKLGVNAVVNEGIEQMVIDAGPAHWPGTAAFGSWGNVVLAGHRSTHTEPFRRVAELAPGDEIILSDAIGKYTYHVTGVEVVPNTALWIKDQKPGRTLTIFSCHPIGAATERIVVWAQLMSAPRPGQ